MMRIFLSAALISVAGASAFAADLPMQAPIAAPVVAPVMNWTGFYVGVDGGGTWGRAQVTHSAIIATPGQAFPVDAATVTAASSPELRLNGFMVGGHFGFN